MKINRNHIEKYDAEKTEEKFKSKPYSISKKKCPTPKKAKWSSLDSARKALADIKAKGTREEVPVRVYHCSCEFYHITKRSKNV